MTDTLTLPSPPEVRREPLFADPAEFDVAWKRRIATLARHVDTAGPVADFGCGMMWLEPLLARGNRYVPIDHVRRDGRTLVADLNRDELPPIDAEFAFLSGILEYVVDVPAFLGRLADGGFRRVILSYCSVEHFPKMKTRLSLNWCSHLTQAGLVAALRPAYGVVAVDNSQGYTMLVLDRRGA